jgi:hypothetical protein
VPYYTDQGGLGLLANAEAVALVEALFGAWEEVPTATIAFTHAGATAVDVDGTNFGPFLGPFGGATRPLGQSVIVFDADGAIFDALFGIGTRVLGFASPTFFSDGITTVPIGRPVPPGAKIIEGLAFLNGKFIDGIDDPPSGNFEIPLAMFEAVFVHEFGHFAGLDHTRIHGLNHPPETDLPGYTQPVETMFPFLLEADQRTLERDDVVALSVLYPTADFFASTGSVAGRVLASDGTPLSGIDVIARHLADDSDAVSYVSGATLVPAGEFFLHGLTPGASYRIEVQEVDAFHTGGSRVGPFSPPRVMPGPPEFYNGVAESADPAVDDPTAFTPIIAAAGVTVGGVDVVLNRQLFSVRNVALAGIAGVIGPRDFAIGDFDRDGLVDFVAPHLAFDVRNEAILFYRGLGGGAFAAPVAVAHFPGNDRIVAAQFNTGVDDFLDIAVLSSRTNEIRVYFGDGAGGFGPPVTLVDAPDGRGFFMPEVAVGDLNDDAYPDLVTLVHDVATGGATVIALLGSAAGSFTAVTTELAPDSGIPLTGLAIAPFADSPAGDVIGVASSVPPALGLLIGDGAGGFRPMAIPLTSITDGINTNVQRIAVGDFDENGTMDVALSDSFPRDRPRTFTRSFIDVLPGDGRGGFTLSARYAVPELLQESIVAADFDGDGHLDIASTGAFFGPGRPGAQVTIAFGNAAGGARDIAQIWGLAEFPTVLVAGDLDGDRSVDLLVSGSRVFAAGLGPMPTYSVLLNQRPGITTVQIDIRPRSIANRINPFSSRKVPVAILSTAAVDATTVDPLSVRFGPRGATAVHGRGHLRDVDGDGDLDLILHFNIQDTGIRCGDTSAALTGRTMDGRAIQGSDAIVTVGCKRRDLLGRSDAPLADDIAPSTSAAWRAREPSAATMASRHTNALAACGGLGDNAAVRLQTSAARRKGMPRSLERAPCSRV